MVKFWGLTDVSFQSPSKHTHLRMAVVGWRLLLPSNKGNAWAHTECPWSIFQPECLRSVFQPELLQPLCSGLVTLFIPALHSSPRQKFCWPWGQFCRTGGCREVTSIPIRAAKLTEHLLHIPLHYTKACKKKSLISLTHTVSVAGTTSCFSLKLSKILLILAGWLKWATSAHSKCLLLIVPHRQWKTSMDKVQSPLESQGSHWQFQITGNTHFMV